MRVRRSLLTAGALAAMAATAPAAFAHAPTGIYAPFAQCPVTVANLSSCIYSDTTSGTIQLGSKAVPISKPVKFQGGITTDPNTGDETFFPAANGVTLTSPAQPIPGGLAGITPPLSTVPVGLRGLLRTAIQKNNSVTATAALIGPAQYSFTNFANVSGPAVVLPLQVTLHNPFLGPDCTIGSAADPVTLQLTDGQTSPPAGDAPLTGSPGTLTFKGGGNLIIATGDSLVDNTFAVPGASGCGPNAAFSPVVDAGLDAESGLPATPGQSSATLDGNSEQAAASAVIANENR